jgi:hypothetical protein
MHAPNGGPCGEEMPQHWYNQGLAIDPANPDHIFFDGIDIWASTDGGATITDVTCGYATSLAFAAVHLDHHALAFAPPVNTPNGPVANTLLAGSDGGIYVSNDANLPPAPESPQFVELNTNVAGSTIEFYSGDISMNFATAPTATIVAGAQDNGSSANVWTNPPGPGPAPWSERFGGDGVFSRIEPKLGQRVYVETPAGGLHISTTGPFGVYTTGLAYPWGSTSSGDRKSFIFPYEIDKFDCKNRNVNPPTELTTCDHMIAGTDWGLYITDNINAVSPTWTRFDASLPHVMIWDMAIDRGATTLAVFTRSRGAFARLLPGGRRRSKLPHSAPPRAAAGYCFAGRPARNSTPPGSTSGGSAATATVSRSTAG